MHISYQIHLEIVILHGFVAGVLLGVSWFACEIRKEWSQPL